MQPWNFEVGDVVKVRLVYILKVKSFCLILKKWLQGFPGQGGQGERLLRVCRDGGVAVVCSDNGRLSSDCVGSFVYDDCGVA